MVLKWCYIHMHFEYFIARNAIFARNLQQWGRVLTALALDTMVEALVEVVCNQPDMPNSTHPVCANCTLTQECSVERE